MKGHTMIDYIEIDVPDFNDSFSKVVLDNIAYLIRFTWNMAAKRWSFGLYSMQKEPIAIGIRIVPRFPLNMQIRDDRFPYCVFGAMTNLASIGRDDFKNGNAKFVYLPVK